ncbi:ALTO [Raccoon-associated polyomavirus 2]|nr:ALTO [Raccoon-associated polyomavirus 2]ARH52636.1 ALTO [Raccoon-associated polyomavirus 2]
MRNTSLHPGVPEAPEPLLLSLVLLLLPLPLLPHPLLLQLILLLLLHLGGLHLCCIPPHRRPPTTTRERSHRHQLPSRASPHPRSRRKWMHH